METLLAAADLAALLLPLIRWLCMGAFVLLFYAWWNWETSQRQHTILGFLMTFFLIFATGG